MNSFHIGKLERTITRLIEHQADMTVTKLLPGSSEWLYLRVKCFRVEKVSPAANSLPVLPDLICQSHSLRECAQGLLICTHGLGFWINQNRRIGCSGIKKETVQHHCPRWLRAATGWFNRNGNSRVLEQRARGFNSGSAIVLLVSRENSPTGPCIIPDQP